MLRTWQSADCSLQEPYNGDFEKALGGIKAKTLVLPSETDLYFPYIKTSLPFKHHVLTNRIAGRKIQNMKLRI